MFCSMFCIYYISFYGKIEKGFSDAADDSPLNHSNLSYSEQAFFLLCTTAIHSVKTDYVILLSRYVMLTDKHSLGF